MFPGKIRKSFVSVAVALAVLLFGGAITAAEAQTISFSGWVKSSPNWPSTEGLEPVTGATVSAYQPGTPPTLINTATPDGSTGAFSLTGIPASTTFFLNIQPPTGYMPVLSKFINWNANIQASLPFVLFTQTQYNAFSNPAETGMILGRVARQDSPATFLVGATVTARPWTPGNPPTLGDPLPVTYTGGGGATDADGIYMVKNVPAGTMVHLVATLDNHTFEFNGAVVPVQDGYISEESFFATQGSTGQVTTFSNEAAFNDVAYSATLIDFEDLGTPTGRMAFVGNEYAGLGITFASPNGQLLWIDPPPTSNWTWPSYYLSPGNTPFMSGDSNEDSLTLTFSPAVMAVGWTFLDMPNPNVVTIRVYDGSNNLIHETSNGTGLVVGADNSAFWGIVSLTPIARVEITDTANDGDDVAYDNFRFAATVTAPPISFSGILKKYSDDTPVGGARIEQVENAAIYTTTVADGTFTLSGLPAGTEFSVRMTGDTATYVPTYTRVIQSMTNVTSGRPFNLFTPAEISVWGVTGGNGAIRGRVMNGANIDAGYVSGATVSCTSSSGNTYTVAYEDNSNNFTTGTGTSANGKYYILNVVEGDTVTVSAAHPYYTFPQSRQFKTHDGSVNQATVNGAAVYGRVAIGGYIMNTATPAAGIKHATIEQVGATAPINATTSNGDGSFYLSVPATTTFHLKFSKPQATTAQAPTYSANMSFAADAPAMGDYK
ncbi:MAG: hypothetical protein V2A79_20405, partial [Planctomycetota bacterium]